jgi:NAD(P)-dependent dehydrogenase (short-subunit alcohol dehydrogenase family)
MRFKNKVALITAAANGIGRATATIMAREGATVIAVDNHQGRLDEAVPALRQAGGKSGGKVEGKLVDALDAGQVDKLVADVARDHGRIDILVNAVGGSTVIDKPAATTEQLTLATPPSPSTLTALLTRGDPGDEATAQRQDGQQCRSPGV